MISFGILVESNNTRTSSRLAKVEITNGFQTTMACCSAFPCCIAIAAAPGSMLEKV